MSFTDLPTEMVLGKWRYGSTQAELLCASFLHSEGHKRVDPQSPLGGPVAALFGHKTVPRDLHKQIKRLLVQELIEITFPDKPNSRLQKYRLTAKGRALFD